MRVFKTQPMLSIINSYVIDSPSPSNISYHWNYGSLLALCLGLQIITGVTLAMHYTPQVDLAFLSVEHIMRDVNYGWFIRYAHANIASFFFIFVYLHIGKGLYYGSYRYPRILLWSIGVIIFLLMIGTAFMGYVLPWGAMSFWGEYICPKYINNNIDFIFFILPFIKIRSYKRIGPHNYDILSIIFGSLLGDSYIEKHGHGSRIVFYQKSNHKDYLIWFYNLINNKGYNLTQQNWKTKLDKYGKIKKIIKFKTYTYTSFNWIQKSWYANDRKILPHNIDIYLSPIALAIWIMNNGTKVSSGIRLITDGFTLTEIEILCKILKIKYNLDAVSDTLKVKKKEQYIIHIHKDSIIKLTNIILPYIHVSMKYKINNYY